MFTGEQYRGLSGESLARLGDHQLCEVSKGNDIAELKRLVDLRQKSPEQLGLALTYAVANNAIDSARYLLQLGVHYDGKMVIDAAKNGSVPMLELLWKRGWRIDDNIGGDAAITSLNIACCHGNLELTKYLPDLGANPDLGPAGIAWGSSAGDLYLCDWKQLNLYHATRIGSVEVDDLLLKYGAKDAAEGNLLHAAITSSSIPMVKHVLVLGPSIPRNTDISFNIDAVKVLLAHGAGINRVGTGAYRDKTVMQLIGEDDVVNQIQKEIKELIRHAAWVESMRVPKQSIDHEMAGPDELDV